MKLQTSKQYGQFIQNKEQREIDENHVDKISKSIKDYGFLPSKPVQVYKQLDKFVIVDGHHRFEAAKKINAEFFYIVEPKSCQSIMAVENKLVKKWVGIDYVRLFSVRGNEHYQTLLHYVNEGIPLTMAASLLYGQQADSGNVTRYIAEGKFKVKTTFDADFILKTINKYGTFNPACKSRLFIAALSKCIKWDGFDLKHFDKRMEFYNSFIKKTSNSSQMLEHIEYVYNYKMQNKVALKMPVEEAARKRNVYGNH